MTSDEIIGQISAIRVKNNQVWMRLLQLAIRAAPSETKALIAEINENDKAVSALISELSQ